MPYVVAADIGGTFTDLVAFDHKTGNATYTKSPTTYGNFVEGILDCFNKGNLAPGEANFLNHGTTLVINSLFQRRGAKCALVTSAGFRDILEIARANRPDPFDLHYQRDEPLIPRGGKATKTGCVTIIKVTGETEIMGKAQNYKLHPGDRGILETGGGGSWGAEERAVELIQRDLDRGYTTPGDAVRDYGDRIQDGRMVRG